MRVDLHEKVGKAANHCYINHHLQHVFAMIEK